MLESSTRFDYDKPYDDINKLYDWKCSKYHFPCANYTLCKTSVFLQFHLLILVSSTSICFWWIVQIILKHQKWAMESAIFFQNVFSSIYEKLLSLIKSSYKHSLRAWYGDEGVKLDQSSKIMSRYYVIWGKCSIVWYKHFIQNISLIMLIKFQLSSFRKNHV